MKKILFTLLFLQSFSVLGEDRLNLDHFKFSFGMSLDIVQADTVKARVFGHEFGVDYNYQFADDSYLFFQSSVILEVGSNDVVGSVAEFEPNESINLDRGGMGYRPFEWFHIQLGALDQGKYSSPLLLTKNAFAAIKEEIILGEVYLLFQQAIPSNNKLSKRLGTVDTGTPYFVLNTIGFKSGKEDFFQLELSHYKFQDLPSNVAEKSLAFGNSISGTGEASQFNYDFSGANFYFNSRVMTSELGLLFSGQYIYNEKAPDGRNSGYLAYLGLEFEKLIVKLEGFKNESDTSPAFYNSKYHGHNNMQGNGLNLQLNQESSQLNLRYAKMTPIEQNSIQDSTEIFQMNYHRTF
ncbi:MAG: hypothetical protein QF441_05835 [Bacteriovoracaceae bacterium]|jgi:hypothetical protein|nr:hypothetical protein [Bacteriovoracaceae bacterium]